MARLLLRRSGFEDRVIELKLGSNRLGRGLGNDFQIEDPAVSACHCEIILTGEEVVVRDSNSTNGTYLDGQPIREAKLRNGQTLRLGSVDLLVEDVDVRVSIPQIAVPLPSPPVVLNDGSLICPRHPEARAVYQCTHCREVLCNACVKKLRRYGGQVLRLCPLCSNRCRPIAVEKKKKKSFLGLLDKTIKLPFARSGSGEGDTGA